jgi:transposase
MFAAYLDQVLGPYAGASDVVDIDLCRHKVAGWPEVIEARGARLLYLPPYSPASFNPIELAGSKLKPGCAPLSPHRRRWKASLQPQPTG